MAPIFPGLWVRVKIGNRNRLGRKEPGGYYLWLIDDGGYAIDDVEVQLARLLVTVH